MFPNIDNNLGISAVRKALDSRSDKFPSTDCIVEAIICYKHHNTIKILVGITPQGTISYVFEAWGGRVSDKFITENCDFLDKLIPGDMVMADRGFTITESVGLKNAKLVIPAFTKGKSQLDPVEWRRQEALQMLEFMLNVSLDCLDGSLQYWKVPCQLTS